MTDFTKDQGQQGISDAQESTSGHTENAWDMIENAATKAWRQSHCRTGADKLAAQISQQRVLVAESIPAPVITVTPSTMQGNIDTGKDEVSIQTYAEANIVVHPGTAEAYLAQKGSIRMWTTEGQYDIYA